MDAITKFKTQLREDRTSDNRLLTAISHRQYDVLISKVLVAKLNKSHKMASDHILLDKYDVCVENNKNKLIVPSWEGTRIYYVHDGELFSVFEKAHLSTQHGNRDQMMKLLKKTYRNISYKDIMVFLNLCEECNKKKETTPDENHKRREILNKQCYVDIIDYTFSPDGQYKFFLIYRELYTKFVMLKPLKTNKPEEIADTLISIFGILGPPSFLQSNCCIKFLNEVIDMLRILWYGLAIKSVKTEGSQNSCAEKIETMLTTWMRSNNNARWSEGIKFVQLKYNTTVNEEIQCTPYEALFKHSVKVGTSKQVEDEDDEELQCDDELDDEDNEVGEEDAVVKVKEEMMDVCKTEPEFVTFCNDCGNVREKDNNECMYCKNNEFDAEMSNS